MYMLMRIMCSGVFVVALGGCIHKPEGPAERIGRSIDEISSAINDMSREEAVRGDDDGQRDRLRRERERRAREAAHRRDRFDGRADPRLDEPYSDDPFDDSGDEFAPRADEDREVEDDRFGDDYRYDRPPTHSRDRY